MQHLFCLCASLTIRMRKLQCEGGKFCLSITWESYVISNEPEKKIMWQIRGYLAGKGKTEHWVVWELCLTLLQVCVLTYTFPSLFIFPFWSQIRIRVGPCFLYAIVTFQFIKLFAQVYNISLQTWRGTLASVRHPKHLLQEKVWQYAKDTKTKVSVVKIFLVFTLQRIWLFNIFRATMGFMSQFTL